MSPALYVDFKIDNLTLSDSEQERVLEVWYQASIIAHSFIGEPFWRAKREVMASLYIPNSETFVARVDGEIVGFCSLVGNTLASLFVHPEYQGNKIGERLLHEAFSRREELQLNVYRRNKKSDSVLH